jgi:hypothetical protein
MSKTPKVVKWTESAEGVEFAERTAVRDVARDESGDVGPFKIEYEDSEGGEGQGENAFYVYKVTDTRDDSVEFMRVDLSYYSYDGMQWSYVDDNDFYVVEKRKIEVESWEQV